MDRETLKRRRSALGYYTYAEFANALQEKGLDRMTGKNYQNRELGKVKFSLREMQAICEVLGWSLEDGLRILM